MLLLFSFTFLLCVLQAVSDNVIVPGATWYDTSGNVIQAHGGGFLKVGSTYYWFGEDKAANSALFSVSKTKIMKYSSIYALYLTIGSFMLHLDRFDQLDKTKQCSNTNRWNYDFYLKHCRAAESYGAAEVGVAIASSPCGPYTYKGSFKPLGADSRDMSLFEDGGNSTQTPYVIFADFIAFKIIVCRFPGRVFLTDVRLYHQLYSNGILALCF
ncbi:hypothetical protein Clacol_008183 [Clathrus columnatus]|uniref:Uncharacterized protein n=1 Tax=Clathrus columnatus TaxID=1419009 RepID=A0AAV5ANC8_9AGAM|nr:hypothetical protein Clacol_008183 [Clathrus columnatus]